MLLNYFTIFCKNAMKVSGQQTCNCSKSTIETKQKARHMFKVNNEYTKTTSLTSFWYFYCYLWTYLKPFPSVSIVDFEQVHICWAEAFTFFVIFLIFGKLVCVCDIVVRADRKKRKAFRHQNSQFVSVFTKECFFRAK